MTANDNSSTSGYVANSSSYLTTSQPYTAFDGSATVWHTQYPYYTENGGVYNPGNNAAGTGTPSGTLPIHTLVSGYAGEYITLGLPKQIKMVKISIKTRPDGGLNLDQTQSGDVMVVVGSHDGSTWEYVDTHTASVYPDDSTIPYTFNVNTSTYYKHVGLICTNTGPIDSIYNTAWSMSELAFYGHEEGDSSLDTTLKSVYNVPGTQLEVYYDGQDYSVMPTVGSASVTDKAGGDQNGTPSSGVSFDSTYKAFNFDGTTNGKIVGTHNLSGTSPTHTISIWFKRTVVDGTYDYVLAVGTSTTLQNSAIVINNDQIWFSIYGDDIRSSIKIVNDKWYHLTVTSNGGIWNSTNCKMYLNGALTSTTSGGGGTFNLTGTQFTLGTNSLGAEQFNGSIANFRLFSKALNADQVKELYDYQKDYFLGSKSQVTLYKGHLGVGVTEPSGQLELAGDERIQEYPPRAMTGYKNHFEGHGVFCVSMSSTLDAASWQGYKAFNKTIANINDAWVTPTTSYSTSTGLPTTSGSKFYGVAGEWIQLDLPYSIKLKQTFLYEREPQGQSYSNNTSPRDVRILGKKQKSEEWVEIFSVSDLVYTQQQGNTPKILNVNSNDFYSSYVLQLMRIGGPDGTDAPPYGFADVAEIKYFGTPGPTTLDKGSLTLGRSLDVPRISRYDVDTETPRPEKLVLDFDTTVNSSPTDISGQGNHGAFYGGASYSAADKAFNLPNTTGILVRVSSLGSGAQPLTLCAWAKGTGAWNATANDCIIGVGPNSSSGNTSFQLCVNTDAITLDMASASNFLEFPTTITNGRWYFIAMTYTGGDAFTNTRVYVDGVEIAKPVSWTNGSSASLALPSNPDIGIGTRAGNGSANSPAGYLGGMVSNPKIYNVALEASEVRKLYNLGRTGRSMVISDTAVGIGKVPEAQLDVRGTIKGINMTSSPAAFSAAHTSSMSVGEATTIIWNDIQYNVGGCYNNSTGNFTAPISGYYYFSFHMLTRNDNETTYVAYFINDADPGTNATYGVYEGTQGNGSTSTSGGAHRHLSGSWLLYLSEGTKFKIVLRDGTSNGNLNRFTGFFVSS